ncbi:MAG: hypothetical protein IH600_04100 [Bacteroidetes bacterium]|nr:hypothetical protein [Bacteroidota bacterium]
MEHHDLKTLLFFARNGQPSAHLDRCAFCREQFELAVDFLASAPEIFQDGEVEAGTEEFSYRSTHYRLAAQSTTASAPQYRLRRTWYLNNNAVILRVIEDTQRQQLTGFFIAERSEDQHIRIRFDGIDREFVPDANGVFEIGTSSIDIEPMKVILLTA